MWVLIFLFSSSPHSYRASIIILSCEYIRLQHLIQIFDINNEIHSSRKKIFIIHTENCLFCCCCCCRCCNQRSKVLLALEMDIRVETFFLRYDTVLPPFYLGYSKNLIFIAGVGGAWPRVAHERVAAKTLQFFKLTKKFKSRP